MKKNSGFTLMELMTVIAIIGIASAIAVPNMISWRSNHQLNGTAREMKSLINGARLAAIKNNAFVSVTYNAGTGAVETSFINRATGVLRTTSTQLKTGIRISASTFTGAPDKGFRFNSRGLPVNLADNSFAAGKVTLSNSKGDSLEVIMASTGVTRIDKP